MAQKTLTTNNLPSPTMWSGTLIISTCVGPLPYSSILAGRPQTEKMKKKLRAKLQNNGQNMTSYLYQNQPSNAWTCNEIYHQIVFT